MIRRQGFKSFFAIFMSIMLLFASMGTLFVPGSQALAASSQSEQSVAQSIRVSVVVSGYSATVGTSVYVPAANTVVEEGKTAVDAINQVLGNRVVYKDSTYGTYITSIDGLAEKDGGERSGWMYLVNGQFAPVGVAEYTLHNSDVITLVYTDDYFQDITVVADKTALNSKIEEVNQLQQANYTAESWQVVQTSLTLAKAVAANSYAIQYHADEALSSLNTALASLVTKPVGQTIPASVVLNGYSANAGKTVTLPSTTINVEIGKTAAYLIEQVLNEKGIPFLNPSGNYITSIGGLAAFDGGLKSGWMYLVNGQFADVGIADYQLKSNDTISLVYTDDYEQDITSVANKTALNAKIAEVNQLQQANYTAESWQAMQASLTLAKAVAANSNAIQYHADSALASLTAALQLLVTKPGFQPTNADINAAIELTAAYYMANTSRISDWSAVGLARTGHKLPESYTSNVISKVQNNQGTFSLVTDLERTILGLTISGENAGDAAGYNLIEKLYSHSKMTNQGINGLLYALIALDAKQYQVPDNALWTRDKIISAIIAKQNADGGFTLGTGASDPDMTAMTLIALAPYKANAAVVKADTITKAVNWLSQKQLANGGLASYNVDNSESVSQTIIALTAIGIDPTGSQFTKNGINLIGRLFQFRLTDGSGTFSHTTKLSANGIATEQAFQAIAAFRLFQEGHGERLYDFTNLDKIPVVFPLPSGDQPQVAIPADNHDYVIPVSDADKNKQITVQIPSDSQSTIKMNLPSGSSLPQVTAVKGGTSLTIPSGSKITSGESSGLQLLTSLNTEDAALKENLSTILPSNNKLDSVSQAITVGGGKDRVVFDQYVTIKFAGLQGKQAVFIEKGVPHAIPQVSSDLEGSTSGSDEYAYDSGSDLIVKTKHFTDYVAYTSSVVETPGGGGGTPTPPPATSQVTLSVDKQTISKGDVVAATGVQLVSGDTAWSVLKRVLDNRGISYNYTYSESYGSVYVQSIAGDGEFDHGSGSGWMYSVNGTYPGYGASNYVLQNGDTVRWRYTTNLGVDLGQNSGQFPPTTVPVTGAAGGVSGTDKKTVIAVPANITQDYLVNVTKDMKNKDLITINIPNVTPKIYLSLEDVKDSIPMIRAVRGDITLEIAKGTVLKSGDSKIELLDSLNLENEEFQQLVKSGVNADQAKAVKLSHAFVMGNSGQSVIFDKLLTLTVQGGEAQLAGYVEGSTFTPIKIYGSEAEGVEATKDQEKITFAYVKDNDLIIRTNHFTSFVTYVLSQSQPQEAANLPYTDANAISAWAADAVKEATQQAFVEGSNGQFQPQAAVSRAEFTKMLAGVLGLDTKSTPVINFKDVMQADWFYPYVNAAYAAGLVSGTDSEHFQPNDKITREQMAVIVAHALGLTAATGAEPVIDDLAEVSDWAQTAVQTLVVKNVMSGWDNRFQPSGEVSREMAVVVAMRAYHTKKETPAVVQADTSKRADVEKLINQTAAYQQQTVTDPVVDTLGGDWTVLGLARSGVPVPDAYYKKYYANVEKILKEKSGKLHSVKYTEYDRVILGLTAIGRSVDQVGGYNLREWLADYDTLIKQGINGPIFALIALDSKGYAIPSVQAGKTQTTRELLIDFILKREVTGGGWALGENPDAPDADITAMAIQGLTPYYAANPQVHAAVDRGLAWLSKTQSGDGGFASGGSVNAESIAQVIVALTGMGINPHTDARFVKNGSSAIDALIGYTALGGGFYHVKVGGVSNGGGKPGEVDPMATDQAMYALVAYDRLLKGQNRLYDMTDVK